MSPRWRSLTFAVALGLFPVASVAFAQVDAGRLGAAPDGGDGEGGVTDAAYAWGDASLEVRAAVIKATEVRALVGGTLALTVEPDTLFGFDLADEPRVRVERARLELLVRASSPDAAPPPRSGKVAREVTDAAVDAAGVEAPPDGLFEAHIELDRARLAFLVLPQAERARLVESHRERQRAAVPKETEAERRAREAEEERQRALARARQAATEAERAISEELARLLDVSREQVAAGDRLAQERERASGRREVRLKAQRRAREAREKGPKAAGEEADAAYDELRNVLRETRDVLEAGLRGEGGRVAPGAGKDRLAALGLESDEVRALRKKVEAEAERLDGVAIAQHDDELAQLLDDTQTLNRERLLLIPYLTSGKRESVTGLSLEGKGQAAAEVRQLGLLLAYHRYVAGRWIRGSRDTGIDGTLAANALFVLVQLVLLGGALAWWRKRAEKVIDFAIARLREIERAEKRQTPSNLLLFVSFLRRVRSPLEWLVFVVALEALLPVTVGTLIEVDVLVVALTWTFAGRVAVEALDALAAYGTLARVKTKSADESRGLRHKSLALLARVVVVFGVALVLCDRLVGRGAIFEWLFSASWVVAGGVALVLVRWWREPVFERLRGLRKPNAFERWALGHDRGWASFLAAASAASYLLVGGGLRAVRSWVGRFDVTRRALAYLFRRKLDRLGQETHARELSPLEPDIVRALGPGRACDEMASAPANAEALARLRSRISRGEGGVVAVVGERGMGKSTALAALSAGDAKVVSLEVRGPGLEELTARLAEATGKSEGSLSDVIRALAASGTRAVLLDDAQRLVVPAMGGLAAFDVLLAEVGAHGGGIVWVVAIDDVVWRFLVQARSARPVFDDIWILEPFGEEAIGGLLRARTAAVGLAPSYELLLDVALPEKDEVERREALLARAASYDRLVWDHAGGNPGVALHLWSRSLCRDESGACLVTPFVSPEPKDLERLPDSVLFVLRAVLQLDPARPEVIAEATNLRPFEVKDALRYAVGRGYVEEVPGGYRVTWDSYRVVVLFLQRRHLLVST
jgi:hypothetical protein